MLIRKIKKRESFVDIKIPFLSALFFLSSMVWSRSIDGFLDLLQGGEWFSYDLDSLDMKASFVLLQKRERLIFCKREKDEQRCYWHEDSLNIWY